MAECLSEWEIFSEDREKRVQNAILDEIMGFDPRDSDISASDRWEAKSEHWSVTPPHQRWSWFADRLKRFRRFVIEEDPTGEIVRPEEWVPDLLKEAHAIREIKDLKSRMAIRSSFARLNDLDIPTSMADAGPIASCKVANYLRI